MTKRLFIKSILLLFSIVIVISTIPIISFAVQDSYRLRLTAILSDTDAKWENNGTNQYIFDTNPVSPDLIGSEDYKKVTVRGYFAGNNTDGWTLQLEITYDTTTVTQSTDAVVKNCDMSLAGQTKTVNEVAWSRTYANFSLENITGAQPISSATSYTLTYNANGGSGAPASESTTTGSVTVSYTQPQRDGYTFLGWGDTSNDTAAKYTGGQSITLTDNKTIYAVWQSNSSSGGDNPGGNDEKDSEPSMSKSTNVTSAARGDVVEFTLNSNVPDYLGSYLNPDPVLDPSKSSTRSSSNPERGKYEIIIHDDLDADMTFKEITSFKINNTDVPNSLYTLDNIGIEGAEFTLKIDLVSLYPDYYSLSDIETAPEIEIKYTVTMSDTMNAGKKTNTAWVVYEISDDNPTGTSSEVSSVDLSVYAVDIYKYDQSDSTKPLSGAIFTMTNGTKTFTAESDSTGHAVFNGLAAGSYSITETQAPENYVKSDKALEVNLPSMADTSTYTASVRFANVPYPHTGGQWIKETLPYLIPGVAVFAAGLTGIFIAVRKRKKSKIEDNLK